MRSENRFMGKLMGTFNPVVDAVTLTNINRRTMENIRTAGLWIVSETNMGGSKSMKRIMAKKSSCE
ncbi:MAG: hypothetical protein NT022_09195 [Deltaproteobacteria bacterium]|nr:hypothetical protein [Deltaproteobacteria bacterium]